MPRRNSDPDVYVSLCGMIRKPFAKSQETLFPLQIPIAREVIWVGGAGGGSVGWLVGGWGFGGLSVFLLSGDKVLGARQEQLHKG